MGKIGIKTYDNYIKALMDISRVITSGRSLYLNEGVVGFGGLQQTAPDHPPCPLLHVDFPPTYCNMIPI